MIVDDGRPFVFVKVDEFDTCCEFVVDGVNADDVELFVNDGLLLADA